MVDGKSPEWLPPGFAERFKHRNGKKIKVYTHLSSGRKFYSKASVTRYLTTAGHANITTIQNKVDNVDGPFPEVSPQVTSMENAGGSCEKKRKGSFLVMLATESTPADDLPPGWIKETKTSKSGNKIRRDSYYTDPVSGYIFDSKLDALRYLKTNDISCCVHRPHKREGDDVKLNKNEIPIDNVEPSLNLSPQPISMTNAVGTHKKKRKGNSSVMVAVESTTADGVPPGWIKEIKTTKSGNRIRKEKSISRTSRRKSISMTNTGDTQEKERKGNSPVTVATESTIADELPPGWIKEIMTTKCGNGMRKDPIDNVQPFPNLSPPSISMTHAGDTRENRRKGTSFEAVAVERTTADGLPPGWIKEIKTTKSGNKIRKDPYYTDPVSGYEFRSKLDALRYVKTNDIRSCMCKPHKRELDDVRLIENEISPSNPANENLSVHKCPLLGGELNGGGKSSRKMSSKVKIMKQKQGNRVPKEDAEVTAGDVAICSPVSDTMTTQQLSGNRNRAKVDSRKSLKGTDLNVPLRASERLAGGEPEMAANWISNENSAENASLRETTHRYIDPLNEVGKPPAVGPFFPGEQSGAKISEKQESHLCDPGGIWPYSIEFALKTLRGGIPIEDTLPFPSCFNEQLSTPYNRADGCLRQSQSDAPFVFQNEVASHPESSKQHSRVDQLPPNSSVFSAHRNIGFTFGVASIPNLAQRLGENKFNP